MSFLVDQHHRPCGRSRATESSADHERDGDEEHV
jgi:hypothetical protein